VRQTDGTLLWGGHDRDPFEASQAAFDAVGQRLDTRVDEVGVYGARHHHHVVAFERPRHLIAGYAAPVLLRTRPGQRRLERADALAPQAIRRGTSERRRHHTIVAHPRTHGNRSQSAVAGDKGAARSHERRALAALSSGGAPLKWRGIPVTDQRRLRPDLAWLTVSVARELVEVAEKHCARAKPPRVAVGNRGGARAPLD
jgi:hypothetical protein